MIARFRPGHLFAAAGAAGAVALLVQPDAPPSAAGPPPWRLPAAECALRPFPREVRAPGGEVQATVAAAPQRVVAGSVLAAEVLLEILPRERLVAVSTIAADERWSPVAGRLRGVPALGQTAEDLLAVRPDLVVTDPYTRKETQILLAAVGVPVVRTLPAADLDDVAGNIRLLGWITGRDAAAAALVADLRRRCAEIAAGAGAVAGWRVMILNGALETYGRGSLFGAAVRLAGATNLPDEHGVGPYQTLDVETVLAWRPDALVVVGDEGRSAGDGGDLPAWLVQHPGLRILPAVRARRVVPMSYALLGSTSHRAVEVAAVLQRTLRGWRR